MWSPPGPAAAAAAVVATSHNTSTAITLLPTTTNPQTKHHLLSTDLDVYRTSTGHGQGFRASVDQDEATDRGPAAAAHDSTSARRM